MSRSHAMVRCAVILFAVAACDPALVAPDAGEQPQAPLAARVTAVPGVYQLEFLDNADNVVTSLPVRNQLTLKAHVEDFEGNDAQSGTVTFEYCSLKGRPPNDITRADEAPLAACADGSATWDRLGTVAVNSTGDAEWWFGAAQIARTVGFRFKYAARRGAIESGVSLPRDFTWTPVP